WPPGQQRDLGPPDRPDEHEPFLVAAGTPRPDEPEQPRLGHGRARFLGDLPAQDLLPRLARLGAAAGPSPALAVRADQHHGAVAGEAESVGSVRLTRRRPG